MARPATATHLTEEQMEQRLRDAQTDEKDGRLIKCETEQDVKKFFEGLHATTT